MKQLSQWLKSAGLALLLFTVLSMAACKKDALKIDQEKTYVQSNAAPATDPILGTSMHLTLKPNGVADILPGGDIVYRGTYDISGNRITVKVEDMDWKFKFTIISESELHGKNGQVLKLVQN